jgi:predicted signal transduction protein with EAL and GGDEF domain
MLLTYKEIAPVSATPSDLNSPTQTSASELEKTQLQVLQALNLLDTPETEGFARITRLANRFFQSSVSAISLTDEHRQWFKSCTGIGLREFPRDNAPCAEVTRSGDVLWIPDMLAHSDFASCALAESGLRFYAGAPLTTGDGFVLGTLCVMDQQPRTTASSDDLASLRDLAAMVIAEIELRTGLARRDPVSRLPNRTRFTEDIADLQSRNPQGERVALLIDLTDPRRFNEVVSVLGLLYIDDLVKASTSILKQILPRTAGLYHVGTTSFALLLDATGEEQWREIVNRVSERFKAPVTCNGIPVAIDAAFGISPFQLSSANAQDVLRTAFSAAHDAREAELPYAVYNSAGDQASRRRFTLLADIREAPNRPDQFTLVYQPRVDVRTKVCVGAEAFLRWQNPYLGNISPSEFIPLVEQTALAGPVTDWVLDTAFAQSSAWRSAGLDARISINISAANLERSDFAMRLAASLEKHKVPASAIELEFAEAALLRNAARVLGQLDRLRALGVELAIDDFGTGYSAFSYLQKLPATTVKIDHLLVRGLK